VLDVYIQTVPVALAEVLHEEYDEILWEFLWE
jgi:hypothetical protein